MSHSSGIPISKALSDAFGQAITGHNTRFIKAQIQNDEVVPVSTHPISNNSYEDDLDVVAGTLDLVEPCYVLFRLDEKNITNGNHLWVLMSYVPDKSKVRDKMTYSSTRSNVRKQLGSANFQFEIHGTVPGDFNRKGYAAFVQMQKSESPLTFSERQSQVEREQGVYVGGGSTAYIHGVAFPVENAATQALQGLISGSHSYVQIAIDVEAEKIILADKKNISVSELGEQVPLDKPAFHFFLYDHDFEGDNVKSIVHVYSCPDGSGNTKSAPVKQRMLYSSSKANVENIIKSLGSKIDASLEVNQGSEVTEEVVHTQIHPPKPEEKKTFAKPKGPSRRPANK